MPSDIVRVIFHFEIPEHKWLSQFSREYPQVDLSILSLLPISPQEGNGLLQMRGANLPKILNILEKKFKINHVKYSILSQSSQYILLNMQMQKPWFLQAIVQSQLILHYPLAIHNGKLEVELVDIRSKIDKLFNSLDNDALDYSIKIIGKFHRAELLTEKQIMILQSAMENAYFNIPRGISLTQLALKNQMAPTSLSEMFRRIYKKLALDFLENH